MSRLLFTCFFFVYFSGFAQKARHHSDADKPGTILWKISGKSLAKPSYLLGTMHLADAEWLYDFSEMKKVIDSTEFILTEAFTTQKLTPQKLTGEKLKALPLLTPLQFKMLDSFFVARVNEGLVANTDASEMTVSEMEGAILITLVTGLAGPDRTTKLIDKDLFELYKSKGRQGSRLDRIAQTDFDSSTIDLAKKYLSRSLKYIEGSNKPGWNIYNSMNTDSMMHIYKTMTFDYMLEKDDIGKNEPIGEVNYVTLKQRNQNWMPKIEEKISKMPCLIAVGLGHLRYKTGVISLLRKGGYIVEPVMLVDKN